MKLGSRTPDVWQRKVTEPRHVTGLWWTMGHCFPRGAPPRFRFARELRCTSGVSPYRILGVKGFSPGFATWAIAVWGEKFHISNLYRCTII